MLPQFALAFSIALTLLATLPFLLFFWIGSPFSLLYKITFLCFFDTFTGFAVWYALEPTSFSHPGLIILIVSGTALIVQCWYWFSRMFPNCLISGDRMGLSGLLLLIIFAVCGYEAIMSMARPQENFGNIPFTTKQVFAAIGMGIGFTVTFVLIGAILFYVGRKYHDKLVIKREAEKQRRLRRMAWNQFGPEWVYDAQTVFLVGLLNGEHKFNKKPKNSDISKQEKKLTSTPQSYEIPDLEDPIQPSALHETFYKSPIFDKNINPIIFSFLRPIDSVSVTKTTSMDGDQSDSESKSEISESVSSQVDSMIKVVDENGTVHLQHATSLTTPLLASDECDP